MLTPVNLPGSIENTNVFDGDTFRPTSEATATTFELVSVGFDERVVVSPVDDEHTKFRVEVARFSKSPQCGDLEGIWHPNGRLYRRDIGPSMAMIQFMDRFPEANRLMRLHPHFVWDVDATDYSALLLENCLPPETVMWTDGKLKSYFKFLLTRLTSQNQRAKMAAEFKLNGTIPVMSPRFVEHPLLPLSPYQRVGHEFAMASEGTALFMDRGTGKTATAINVACTIARARVEERKMARILIVCPNQVRTNWRNEIGRFTTLPGKVTDLRGGKTKRIQLLTLAIKTEPQHAFSAIVVGYDTAVSMMDQLGLLDWDLVILDESHYIKSASTARYKTLIQLRDCSKRRLVLTGTPIGNSPMDLWTQLEFLGRGLSGFTSYKRFRAYYGVWEAVDNAHGVDKLIAVRNMPMLQERLARISFSVTKAEAGLNLPDKVYTTVEAEMSEEQTVWYRQISEELVLEIENKLDGGDVDSVTAENILTMLLRLAQVASGFVTIDAVIDSSTGAVVKPKQIKRIAGENPKIIELMALVLDEDRDPNAKTVIWCQFVEDIRRISEELTARGAVHGCYYGGTSDSDREEFVHRFNNDPAFKILVCNPQTAGEGLNLLGFEPSNPSMPTYCDMEVFYSQNWSAIQRAQAEDRAHRRGTRMPVQIIDLVIPGTVDEEIRARVQQKQAMANVTLDIRSVLQNVLGI